MENLHLDEHKATQIPHLLCKGPQRVRPQLLLQGNDTAEGQIDPGQDLVTLLTAGVFRMSLSSFLKALF